MICDGRRCEEAGKFETTVAIRRTHCSNLDALTGQAGDTSRPFFFDRATFEFETDLSKKIYCPFEVLDDDSYVVHPLERHMWNLQDVVWFQQWTYFATPKHERHGACQIAPE